MVEQAWYAVSYDIAEPRRGQRVQRNLKRHASQLLESLYLYRGTAGEMAELLRQTRRLAGPSAADVVAYGLRGPMAIRAWGRACQPEGIVDFSLPPIVAYRGPIALLGEGLL